MLANAGENVWENPYKGTEERTEQTSTNRGQAIGEKGRETGKWPNSAYEKTRGKHVIFMIIKNNKNKYILLAKYFYLVLFLFPLTCFVWFLRQRHVGLFRRWSTGVVFVTENIHWKMILRPYFFILYFDQEVNDLMAHTFHPRCATLEQHHRNLPSLYSEAPNPKDKIHILSFYLNYLMCLIILRILHR